MSLNSDLYQKDFYTWCILQENILDKRNLEELDIQHLKEEIKALGERHFRELKSRLTNLFLHLLKWKYQPNLQSHSWIYSIRVARKKIPEHLKEYPGLQNEFEKACEKAYSDARWECSLESGLVLEDLPIDMPFTIEEALDLKWMPD